MDGRMSGQSLKTQWQIELAKSGLGHRAVCTGLVMSLTANADGTRMFPSMLALAEEMGCDRKYVTAGRGTLMESGWLTFVAKAVPGHKGTEFLPTFGRQVSLSGTLEAVAKCPSSDGQVSFSDGQVSFSEAPSVPERVITMEEIAPFSKTIEEHHGPTAEPTGDAAWAVAEAEAEAEAAASAELMARAPSFD